MHKVFIGGAWVDAQAAASRDVVNPATLRTIGAAPDCGDGDVGLAVSAAGDALPHWRALEARQRAILVSSIGAAIRILKPELAALLTRESGKPLCESADCIDAAADLFERARAPSSSDAARAGVIAAIMPFNFPLLMMAAAAAPALAAGHTLVFKPAPQNPLASLMLARVYDALPPGVVNVLTGGSDTALALVRHPGVHRVLFTGSAQAAERLQAAGPGKPMELDMGVPDAFVVCGDANLDLAVPAVAWARLINAGQGCGFGGHVYVERGVAAEFVDRMHPCMGFLDVDDPTKPPTDLGPLISLDAALRVEDQVGRMLRTGAKLILGGRRFRPSGLPGHFFQPTILTNVPKGGVPARENILGPVMTITAVTDIAEAISIHSSQQPNFGASILTCDPERAVTSIDTGRLASLRVNDPSSEEQPGPFSGMRHAGLRRAFGVAGGVQTAAVLEPKPWWFPYLTR